MNQLDSLEQIAASRRTLKVMSQTEQSGSLQRGLIERLLGCAGWAPFHRVCSAEHRQSSQMGIEPWRFYVLEAEQCRRLRELVIESPVAGKIPAMLATAGALVIATWLPSLTEPEARSESLPKSLAVSSSASPLASNSLDPEAFEPSLVNVEHIAAASAAVQTLLLAAAAAGIESYWSSGGVLRSPEITSQLSIPANQRVLGAIFLFPETKAADGSLETATSKLRGQRGGLSSWTSWVQL